MVNKCLCHNGESLRLGERQSPGPSVCSTPPKAVYPDRRTTDSRDSKSLDAHLGQIDPLGSVVASCGGVFTGRGRISLSGKSKRSDGCLLEARGIHSVKVRPFVYIVNDGFRL